MIYLIGGPPRCGKTKLSTKLSKEIGVTLFPGDELEGVVRPYVCDSEYPEKFPKNILRENTGNSNDEMYLKYSAEEILDAYLNQGATIQHAIEVIIETMIQTKQNLILEGYHLTPAFVSLMQQKYGAKNFKSLFLVKTSISDALKTIRASKDADDWVHTKTTDPEIHNKIAEFIVKYSDFIVKECKKYGLKHLDYTRSLADHLNLAAMELTK